MKHPSRITALLATMALVAVACGGGDDGETAGGDEQTGAAGGEECGELEPLSIAMPSLPPDYIQAGPFLARDLGYFEEYCIDIELTSLRSGIKALQAMQAGETDASMSGTVSYVNAAGEGSPLKVWFSPQALTDFEIAAVDPVSSCADFDGQTVATDGPGGLIHAIVEAFLATCDLTIGDEVEVFIGSPEDFGPQLKQGVAQGTALHLDDRLITEQELDLEFNILGRAWEYAPNFHYASFGSTEQLLGEKRDLYIRASAAMMKANRWLKDPENREEAIERIAEIVEVTPEIAAEAYDTFNATRPGSCAESIPKEAFQFLVDLQVELGNLAEPVEYDDIVVSEICEEGEALLE